uniref:Uncharacterized protein n=1 Tax=Candidatus Kentrum sp. FW TaxID=2126338 RepID=A0A450U196_9GAMM|nr:MAG: hypothetical protein BECKFW1821C_GA0114237_11008 [Candidatus Kentron sp. FW]
MDHRIDDEPGVGIGFEPGNRPLGLLRIIGKDIDEYIRINQDRQAQSPLVSRIHCCVRAHSFQDTAQRRKPVAILPLHLMLYQNDGSIRDAEINITVRSDSKVIPNTRRYRNLTLCCYLHGIAVACITAEINSP